MARNEADPFEIGSTAWWYTFGPLSSSGSPGGGGGGGGGAPIAGCGWFVLAFVVGGLAGGWSSGWDPGQMVSVGMMGVVSVVAIAVALVVLRAVLLLVVRLWPLLLVVGVLVAVLGCGSTPARDAGGRFEEADAPGFARRGNEVP